MLAAAVSVPGFAPSYMLLKLTILAFNHSQSREAEEEYDRLRDLARQEAGKRSSCFDRVCECVPLNECRSSFTNCVTTGTPVV